MAWPVGFREAGRHEPSALELGDILRRRWGPGRTRKLLVVLAGEGRKPCLHSLFMSCGFRGPRGRVMLAFKNLQMRPDSCFFNAKRGRVNLAVQPAGPRALRPHKRPVWPHPSETVLVPRTAGDRGRRGGALPTWAGAAPWPVPAPTRLSGSTAGSKEGVLESDHVQTRCSSLALGKGFPEVSAVGPLPRTGAGFAKASRTQHPQNSSPTDGNFNSRRQ